MLFLILGGAAVYRCDDCIVLSAASAAEVTTLARQRLFPQTLHPLATLNGTIPWTDATSAESPQTRPETA